MEAEPDANDDEQTKPVHTLFENICRDLSVDRKVADIAWRGYDAVRKQCTLEVSAKLCKINCYVFTL